MLKPASRCKRLQRLGMVATCLRKPMQRDAQSSRPFAYPAATRLRAVPTGAGTRLLNVREVAERLGVCSATVYTLCQRGELPHIRVSNAIRVAPADLAAFIARGRSRGIGAA